MTDVDAARRRFAALHESGTFLMPNVWDAGSARLFVDIGFDAVATTSSGFAATRGRLDQTMTLDELAGHVADLVSAVDVPVSVDAEDGYADDQAGLVATVEALAEAGAAGISIEDYRPGIGLLDLTTATERVGVYADAARARGLIVTARAENHLYGVDDLDDTIDRLRAYAGAGANVVYPPGLLTVESLSRVVAASATPVNALLLPGGPTVGEMKSADVRRLSTGGGLAWVAYGAAVRAGRELYEEGTQGYATGMLRSDDRVRVFES
jgi:2-methylisocitrate lyase-like PEP mutase family enzyme